MNVWNLFEELFDLVRGLSSPKSPLGAQLELMRLSLNTDDGTSGYRRLEAAEQRYYRYQQLVKLWALLSPEEQRAIMCQHTPCGTQEYTRTVPDCDLRPLYVPLHEDATGICGAVTSSGGVCQNKRSSGEVRCGIKSHRDQQGQPKAFVTLRGEEFVSVAHDDDGKTLEGYSFVRGKKDRYPTYAEIGDLLGVHESRVRELMQSATRKVIEENRRQLELQLAENA